MPRPENPLGSTPITWAVFWIEKPCPVAEKCAWTPPTVRSKGSGAYCGPSLKSNSTLVADAAPLPVMTSNKAQIAVRMGASHAQFHDAPSLLPPTNNRIPRAARPVGPVRMCVAGEFGRKTRRSVVALQPRCPASRARQRAAMFIIAHRRQPARTHRRGHPLECRLPTPADGPRPPRPAPIARNRGAAAFVGSGNSRRRGPPGG